MDDDLTDDFLHSLDTLTAIRHTRKADSNHGNGHGLGADAANSGAYDYEYGHYGSSENDRTSESRLSAFTAEELQQLGFFGEDDDLNTSAPWRTQVITEEEGDNDDDDDGDNEDNANGEYAEAKQGGEASGHGDGEEEKEDDDSGFMRHTHTKVRRLHGARNGGGGDGGGGEYDQDDEADEYADEVSQLENSTADLFGGSFYSDSMNKGGYNASYQSDGTDRSYSFASECTDFSPVQSPHEVNVDRSATYEQRLEASVQEHHTSSQQSMDGGGDAASTSDGFGERHYHPQSQFHHKPFTMDDIAHFEPHFGRDVFLEELGRSFTDGSGSKSLASYRMSSVMRISQNNSAGGHGDGAASVVIKQGWLMKRGEFVRSWHKRWFTLRRMPQGPMLTYARDNSDHAPAKVIDLSSTSRCTVVAQPAKASKEKHEFRILTSADSRREFAVYATSHYELTEWVRAIQSSINAGNKSAFEGAADFQRIWNDTGIQGFLVRYGMRKVSSRNHMQTRVLELNFADQTITNSRRGESLSTLHFNDLVRVSPTKQSGEEFGLVLDFHGKHRSWSLFLDTCEARDDLMDILQKIATKEVIGEDLEARCSRFRLKCGQMERRNVGPQATLKGKLFVCLYENSVVFYPDGEDVNATRPWYVVALRGLNVSCNEAKCTIAMGRLLLTCASLDDCRNWYQAILAAKSLPPKVIELELRERATIRNAFHSSVFRLRKLLKANVKPEVNGPPKDIKTIELMMRKLWELTFPGEPYTSNADPRWQELGFQRGGPASDLRSSGLLGLYCLIYFVSYPSRAFKRILDRTRFGVSDGNMKNYPLAIGCINVVAILTETLGFGDAGSHSQGCSPNAMKTFVRFVADTVGEPKSHQLQQQLMRRAANHSSLSGTALDALETWDEIVTEAENHVFEDMFCILYPVLDSMFVAMDAGYMEFGQVVVAFRRRLGVIFDALPRTFDDLRDLADEPCTETLVAPSIISKGLK